MPDQCTCRQRRSPPFPTAIKTLLGPSESLLLSCQLVRKFSSPLSEAFPAAPGNLRTVSARETFFAPPCEKAWQTDLTESTPTLANTDVLSRAARAGSCSCPRYLGVGQNSVKRGSGAKLARALPIARRAARTPDQIPDFSLEFNSCSSASGSGLLSSWPGLLAVGAHQLQLQHLDRL